MSDIVTFLAVTLCVPKPVIMLGLLATCVAGALSVSNKDCSTTSVKIEMDPWERVKLAEAMRRD